MYLCCVGSLICFQSKLQFFKFYFGFQGAFVKIQSIKGILLAIHKNFVPQISEAVQ